MKSLSPELQAHLDSGATTLCTCWKLTRRDGLVLGFTDHDRALSFDGVAFEAVSGMTATAMETTAGLSVDNLDVLGALTSGRLSEADLAAGLFDDAEVEIWRVNWQAPAQRVLLRKGHLGEVSRGRGEFRAEVRGLAHRLNQPVGRIYQYTCDAEIGDVRCGVDLTAPAFRGTGTVTALRDARILEAAGLDGYAAGWFTAGLLTVSDGPNAGLALEVRRHWREDAATLLEVWQALPAGLDPGTGVTVSAGCDKSFATCKAKFANHLNFRGFHLMPGNDFVTSYPRRGEGHGGGALRS